MGAELEVIRERERKKKKVEEVEVESLGPNKQKKVNLFSLSFVFSQLSAIPHLCICKTSRERSTTKRKLETTGGGGALVLSGEGRESEEKRAEREKSSLWFFLRFASSLSALTSSLSLSSSHPSFSSVTFLSYTRTKKRARVRELSLKPLARSSKVVLSRRRTFSFRLRPHFRNWLFRFLQEKRSTLFSKHERGNK